MKWVRDIAIFGAGCCFGAAGLIVVLMVGFVVRDQLLSARPQTIAVTATPTLAIMPTAIIQPTQFVPSAAPMPLITAALIQPEKQTPAMPPTITLTLVPVPTNTPLPTVMPLPTPAPIQAAGVTYAQICDVDESNMTDPQLTAHAAQFAGQSFAGWQGWVYDVGDRGDGSYNLEIAMEERGFFWTRNVVVESIPTELAVRLNVEQPIVFSGRVARVDYTFEVMCNPMFVDSLVLQE